MKLVLFDGECGFCSASVQFIYRRDSKALFLFSSIQSQQKRLLGYGIDDPDLTTLYYIDDDVLYSKSTAVLKIAKELDGLWRMAYVFILIPEWLRDKAYDFVAKHRYKIIAKSNCPLPDKGLIARMID